MKSEGRIQAYDQGIVLNYLGQTTFMKLEVADWNFKLANSSDTINFLAIIFLLGISSPLAAAFYTGCITMHCVQ